jgi:putative ABC transport system substrate-binding protein
MRRRTFIAGLGSAAAWQVTAQAQQRAIPIIAYLSTRSAESDRSMVAAFRRGLNQSGFEEGRNLTVEYRFADGKYDLVPALVTELVDRRSMSSYSLVPALELFPNHRGSNCGPPKFQSW